MIQLKDIYLKCMNCKYVNNKPGTEPCHCCIEEFTKTGNVTKYCENTENAEICEVEEKPENIRKQILEKAIQCVCTDRNEQYGSPENSFASIAEFWSAYLGKEITPHDVGVMMALFKIARIKTGSGKADNYIDCAGYIACAGELADKIEVKQ